MTTAVEQRHYACDYESFKKIKLLHKYFWEAKRAEAAYNRYYRKQPHNRVIRKKNKVELAVPIQIPAPPFPAIYSQILKRAVVPLYQQARHPVHDKDQVKSLPISIRQVEEWLEEIEKANR